MKLEVEVFVHDFFLLPGAIPDAEVFSLNNDFLFHQLKYWMRRWLMMT